MTAPTPASDSVAITQPASRRGRWLLAIVALLVAGGLWWRLGDVGHAQKGPGGMGRGEQGPQPVTAAVAKALPLPVWFTALGTVTPRSLVNVMPRVAGLLQSVDYKQGRMVKAGQLLAQIDPRPFQIAVAQAQAQVEQTQAQLAGAQRDLVRYETLLGQDSIAAQQVSDQRATVAQLKATLDANKAALNNAKLQLSWTRITAPVAGLAGLRPVDAGNMVTTSGAVGAVTVANSGGGTSAGSGGGNATPIAVIAQVQPVDVTFALPQQQIGEVVGQLLHGKQLEVQAWDARNTKLLATGKLVAADNQINTSTGTLNLRAEFDNKDLALFPNQFVNVRLLVRTLPDAVVVPSTAVAVGAPGTYVYVIGAGDKVALRKVVTGAAYENLTQIVSGVRPGERVVTDGLDRLRDGSKVRVVQARQAMPGPVASGAHAGRPDGKAKPAAAGGAH
ncbi:MAG: efflux RND transporter periplasmic adaptor subunit [Betaproteobacteria bacterium]|jgi:multidrug efflux system membrane fusion protein|uniref:Multidrug efflux system, subunit A n=1 Tax=Thiomonas delicata TaxID=364030 RepID=A0A238D4L3_THIDL|nr:efflux RND transporter periplasmic adaptor subunit [Thiomonas delicata]MDE2129537.1 efflux RND transporter periplasmic adaptor subunit [Betaproteobacteria bacterium]OZB45650.1 MAG: efflux transporter periplasmic adaptor subunit [Thiomonas sp. 15-66-11]OZB62805.1 MAG: efflux transporter periplasmic adaptor subunit [Thiomonas sp. 13-66-29]SBP88233.1 multidrug efflux system, subunit A [Thiomonas delicata]